MEDTYTWYRCKLISNAERTERSLLVDGGQVLTEDEVGRIEHETILLIENTESSPFAHLQTCYDEFKKEVASVAIKMKESRGKPEGIHLLSGKLDNFLSALRGFDDRTSHNLSKRYGKDSSEYVLFKQALSYEFDNVFEYRFMWHLRNYSQHVGNPISNIYANVGLEDGVMVSECQSMFDSKVLLGKYKEWHRLVKHDLQEIDGEFSVVETMDITMAACSKIYLKLLLAQESTIEGAANFIKEYDYDGEYEYPMIVRLGDKSIDHDSSSLTLSTRNVRIDLAQHILSLLERAHVLVG